MMCKKNLGFTLIELMVVIIIVGSVVGLVTVGFDSLSPGTRLSAAAREMASTLTLAFNQAVIRKGNVTIYYNLDKNYYQLSLPPILNEKKRKTLTPRRFPSGVKFHKIMIAGEKNYTSGWVEIKITPLGMTAGHVVQLKNNIDDKITIEINPITTIISIVEGESPPSFIETP